MSDTILRAPPRTAAPEADRWLEALPTPVLGVDAGERIRFVNAAAADLLANVGRGVLGRRLGEVFGADAPLVGFAHRALGENAHIAVADVSIAGPGFSLGRFSVAAAPVGEQGFVVFVLTPTPRTRPLMAANANSAARTLAHEVRNPLAGIRAAAQLIGRAGDAETRELSKLICDEVDRVHRLTERIDPIGALEAPRQERFNIHEALERVRQLVQNSAPHVTIRERYDPSLPLIRGDMDQLIQALLNIAKNAAEALYGHEDGQIVFSTAFRPGVRFRAQSGSARAQLEVQIIDNGPGLNPDVADRVFDAFATTKSGGMGLGLTVAADIVARHEGRIEVESAPGRTAFRIWLPIESEEAPS